MIPSRRARRDPDRATGGFRCRRLVSDSLLPWAACAAALRSPCPAPRVAPTGCLSCHDAEDNVGDAALVVDVTAWEATPHGARRHRLHRLPRRGSEEYPHTASDARRPCVTATTTSPGESPQRPRPARSSPDLRAPTAAAAATASAQAAPGCRRRTPRRSDPHGEDLPAPATANPEMARRSRLQARAAARRLPGERARPGDRGGARRRPPARAATAVTTSCPPPIRGRWSTTPERAADSAPSATARSPRKYQESVHGVAAAAGIRESPVCTDCHGEHRIVGPREAGSPVFASNVPKMTCGRCHADLRMTEKFGIKDTTRWRRSRTASTGSPADRAAPSVANCASCHGVHDILPLRRPALARQRRPTSPATCGSCHPGRRAALRHRPGPRAAAGQGRRPTRRSTGCARATSG